MRQALLVACVGVAALQAGLIGENAPQRDWPAYGRDPGGMRHSPLTQITPQNVARLQRAWVYHTGEKVPNFEVTPVVVGNVMFLSTPSQRVIALDATTGTEIWTFEPNPKVARGREHRGVSYWPGDRDTGPRILLATSDARLIAIDAKTGTSIPEFGENGAVNLREGVADKFPQSPTPVTSPPAIYRNLAILGTSTQEGPSKGPAGDPRAFDIKTGKLVWRFRLVPHPGEPGNETWGPPDGWIDRSGPSTWGLFTVDTERGLVFIPTGNPADSYYGADRKGSNRFSASVICLDAATGALKWDYQTVHHDIFDMDVAAAPALIDVVRNGRRIPAVAEITKMGLLFILDRLTGQPIFGVEERPVPKTDVPGEEAWPTQPFPVKPPALARNSFTPSEISRVSPESEAFCGTLAGRYTNDGPFTPYRIATGTVLFSGSAGGGNWGGVAFDPRLGYIIVNTSEMATFGRMVQSTPGRSGRGSAMPYRNEGGSTRFVDQDHYPCQQPPWGRLSAVNANTGDVAWSVTLGSYDEMEAKGLKNIGAANLGGAITTATGLTLIAATNDLKFRAFDTKTGKELWMTRLDASGNATPITYMGRDDRQFVVVVAGGPGHLMTIGNTADDHADSVIAFALPRVSTQAPQSASAPDGQALFTRSCASCHSGAPNSRASSPDVLTQRAPATILDALSNGAMRVQGSKLTGAERRAIAEYLSGKAVGGDPTGTASGRCTTNPAFNPASGPMWNGWGATPANTRFQSAKDAGLTADQVPRLTLKWAFGFPDATSAWAPPIIVGGRVFVGSHNGTVYSLDAKSGCIYWYYSAEGGARTAMTVGPRAGGGFNAYFGDTNANMYALDAATGKLIWKTKIEQHVLARITGSPTLDRNRLYVGTSSYEESQGADPNYGCCTFRGSVSSIDVATGKVVWKTFVIADEPKPRGTSTAGVTLYGPSGSSIWSAPTVDAKRNAVYVATGNTYTGPEQPSSDAVIAVDITTGRIKWMKQLYPKDIFVSGCRPNSTNPNCQDQEGPDFDFGNAPILAKLPNGKDAIVIGQKSGIGWAIDPDKQGEVIWQYRAGVGGALGGIEFGSAVDDERAYFPVSDITTPKPGGLHAVSLQTGERVWFTPAPAPMCGSGRGCNGAQAAAISVIPGVVFSGSNDGAMRAYSTRDGSIIWEVDTNREFTTVNGVPARGASMLAPGPAIAGGMVVFNSGYGAFGGRPGNVLLGYGVESSSPSR